MRPTTTATQQAHMSRQLPDHNDDASDEDDLALDELDPTTSRRMPDWPVRSDSPFTASVTRSARRGPGPHSNGIAADDDDLRGLLEDESGSEDGDDQHAKVLPGPSSTDAANGHARGTPSGLKRLLGLGGSNKQDADRHSARIVYNNSQETYPSNAVSNAKYSPWSFLPRTLYNEFSFFFNLYFLLVALSQIIPPLRIGYLSTYIAPLAFVLTITLGKEAYDDIIRRRRDSELNAERFTVLKFGTNARRADDIGREEQLLDTSAPREVIKTSKDIRVGDILKLGKDQRVPADAVVLKTIAHDVADQGDVDAFIRTDQLDGETDWKLRVAPSLSQRLPPAALARIQISTGKPTKNVNDFVGNMTYTSDESATALTIDNTAWANTVLASTVVVYAMIIYTGPETRQALSISPARSKTGLLEYEINSLTKILCAITLLLSVILVGAYKFESPDGNKWYVAIMRFLILFSTIVPISLRVNLDLGKSVYAWFIHRDPDISGAVVRTSTIPEDLGRVEYLLSDKTGTLTQNDMQLKKVHIGTVSYANDAMEEVMAYVRQGFASSDEAARKAAGASAPTRSRREIGGRVRDIVMALALCHNVTPTVAEEHGKEVNVYQASSPDEIAIVKWTEQVGLRLVHRDRHGMTLEYTSTGETAARVDILNLFPFTSEGKRMGIIVRFTTGGDNSGSDDSVADDDTIWFFQKGADTVMASIVASNDWLDEETSNMAREGLRTLVVGRKKLSGASYKAFADQYRQASMSLQDRDRAVASVIKQHLERDLELLGVTGVEDKLQQDVKSSLELLRNAGIKIWMLTGDKVETARCVAISAKLVARGQYVHTIAKTKRPERALEAIEFLQGKPDACLLVDGESLATLLLHHRDAFINIAVQLSAVIACRCSPTQKADVALLIRKHTGKRVCCIGDGGNDVSMIQAADVGIGIVGKEGKQASLAADFSVTMFCHLTKLLLWHGRNSYKRSAKLAQFVMHRGLIISVCQTVFSIAARYEPRALYKDWLLVGYATVYTMMPVFSLVLDTDIPPRLAHVYPELYAELSASRALSYGTFFAWVAISVYQGVAIQLLAQILTAPTGPRMVAVGYTSLIFNELAMVAAEVTTWHWIMVLSILGTLGIYMGTLPTLGGYYDLPWVWSTNFWWRTAVVTAAALTPVLLGSLIRRKVRPESYRKVMQGG